MRIRILTGVALVGCVGLSVSVVAQKPPKPSSTQVTSIISDYDSGVAPALQIQSDQLGSYVPSSTLKSEIFNEGGSWVVDSYLPNGATRTIALNFTQPIPGTGPNGGAPVSPPSGTYKVRLISECWRDGNNFLTLLPGQTMQCRVNVHFDYGGKTYNLHMARTNTNFPETDSANVTCIFPTSGTTPCQQWRLWPTGTYQAEDGTTRQANVANLSIYSTVKGKVVHVKQGNFYVSFSIIFMKP